VPERDFPAAHTGAREKSEEEASAERNHCVLTTAPSPPTHFLRQLEESGVKS